MSNYLSEQEIKIINDEINDDYSQIEYLESQINKIKLNIEYKKKYLIKYCNHNKKINHSIISEHTEYYCDKCKINL